MTQTSAFPHEPPAGSSAVKVQDGLFKFVLEPARREAPPPVWQKGANALFHYQAYYTPMPEDERKRAEAKTDAGETTSSGPIPATEKPGSAKGSMNILAQLMETASQVKKKAGRDSSCSSSGHDHHHHHHHHDHHDHHHHHDHHDHHDHANHECKANEKSDQACGDSSSATSQLEGDGAASSAITEPPKLVRKKVGDSTQDGKPFELRIGREFSVKGMEAAVKSMRVGERARFLLSPELGEGYSQLEAILRKERDRLKNPNAPHHMHSCGASHFANHVDNADLMELFGYPLELEIKLLDVQQPGQFRKQLWEMSGLEKRQAVLTDKDLGAQMYRSGKCLEAIDAYSRALGILENLAVDPEILEHDRRHKKQAISSSGGGSKVGHEERATEDADLAALRDTPGGLASSSSSSYSSTLSRDSQKSAIQISSEHQLPKEQQQQQQQQQQEKHQPTDKVPMSLAEIKSLIQTCRLNFAACKLKLDDFGLVVEQCTLVLSEDPNNEKALFRRAQAYIRIGRDLDLAEKDLTRLLRLQGVLSSPDAVALERHVAARAVDVVAAGSKQAGNQSAFDGQHHAGAHPASSSSSSSSSLSLSAEAEAAAAPAMTVKPISFSTLSPDAMSHILQNAAVIGVLPEVAREIKLLDSKNKIVRQKERAMFKDLFSS